MTKKLVKKLSIILGIILIVLWFGGNLGLYIFIKYSFTSEIEKVIDYIPEKLKLKEADVKAETLYLMGYKFKFPFYEEDIKSIAPFSFEHEFSTISISLGKKDNFEGNIFLGKIPSSFSENKERSLVNKVWGRILYREKTYTEFMRAMHYSRLTDYSWWNLLHNIRLSELLVLKVIGLPNYESFKVYDLETPYFSGFLREGTARNKKTSSIIFSFDLIFDLKGESYSIHFMAPGDISDKFKNIISTIQPVDNIENSYKEMEALYRDKESRYPEELILISMITLKGSTIENLKELLRIMEEKNYDSFYIEDVKKEIEYLEKQ